MSWLIVLILAASPVPQKTGKELTLDMHERFAYAAMMRTALIHGYLDRARRHAGQLEDMLENSESTEVAELAGKVATANTIADAALAIAQVGEACGQCHEANRVRPQFLGKTPAPRGDSLVARMGRHIWAADRMWEGLVAHSPDAWQRGAKALGRDAIFHADSAELEARRIREVQEIARRAAAPQPWSKRARIYGEFLAACTGCHQAYVQQSP